MFEVALFLGFPVDIPLANALAELDPSISALFIQEKDSDYLKKVIYQQSPYIGKSAGDIVEIDQLSLIEANIRSILKKLLPHYSQEHLFPLLFPIPVQ